ncbi:hypothetical protein PSTT_07936, partial [Puccinia striiformis]
VHHGWGPASWTAIFQGKTTGNGLDVGHVPCQTPAESTIKNRTPVELYRPIMNSYLARSFYLVFYLVNQVGLASLGPIITKETEILLDLIESSAEKTRFDLNAVPPEEPSIISLSSALPSSPILVFGVDLNLPREQVEPHSLVLTHDFVPTSHYPSSASKRKFINPNADSIVPTHNLVPLSHHASRSNKRKIIASDVEQSGSSRQSGVIKQGTANSAQLKQINLPMRRSDDTLHVPVYHSLEVGSISSSSELLDMYDWCWIIVDPSAEKANGNQGEFGKLNSSQNIFRSQHEPLCGNRFSIPEGDEQAYLADFHGQRKKKHMMYPPANDLSPSQVQSGIMDIIKMIADGKLDLGSYMDCFSDVWDTMKSRINTMNKTAYSVENALKRRISYLKKMAKVTTTLSVFYLSLFEKHEGGRLKKQHIQDSMTFMKNIFKQCQKDEALLFTCNEDFSKKWHTLWNFGGNAGGAANDLGLAWKTVGYLLDNTGQRSRFTIQTYHSCAVEIINKIIFWSNYKKIKEISALKNGLAILGRITTQEKEVFLDLNESRCKKPRLDLNAVPPEEPSIIPLSSTLPSSPILVFGVDLTLPREQVGPHSIVSTDRFVPMCHYSSSASKRKVIGPDVDSIGLMHNLVPLSHYASSSSKRKLIDSHVARSGTSREKKKSVSKPQEGVKNQGTFNSAQLKQINLASMRRSEDTLHVPTYNSPEVVSISSPSELLDMYDWNWIIVDPSAEKASETQKKPGELNNSQNVFKCLNSLRREPLSGRIFWIPEGDEHAYLQDFHGQRGNNDMMYPPVSDFTPSQRQSGIMYVIKRIADGKLDLGSHMDSFADKIAKVSTTLSVFYLSLFGRHEGGRLNKQHISDFMSFIKDIYNQCQNDQAHLLTCQEDFAKKWHTLMNLGGTISSASNDLALAWRTVEYWLDKTGQRSRFMIGNYHPDAVEIINKIIFWSNYKTIEGITTSKREKRTKQTFKQ